MLGRLRMTVRDCLDEYKALGGKVFGRPHIFTELNTGVFRRPQYDTEELETIFREVCRRHNHEVEGNDTNGCIHFPFDRDLCKTYVHPLNRERRSPGKSSTSTYSGGETMMHQVLYVQYTFAQLESGSNSESSFVTTLCTYPCRDYVDQLYLIRTYDFKKKPHYSKPPRSRTATGLSANTNSRVSTGLSRTDTTTHPGETMEGMLANRRPTRTGLSMGSTNRNQQLTRHINYGDAQMFEIWQVVRAATAADMFFRPMRIPKKEDYMSFTDGGFGPTNNPTREGISEIEYLRDISSVNIVVSIGTARKDQQPKNHIVGKTKRWVDRLADPEEVNRQVEVLQDRERFDFFRLNAPQDQALDVGLDEWKPGGLSSRFSRKASGHRTIEKIERAWDKWAADKTSQDRLRDCAVMLVQHRRARAKLRARWERFATCAKFTCPHCMDYGPFHNRDKFRDHITNSHDYQQNGLERKLDSCKEEWRYR